MKAQTGAAVTLVFILVPLTGCHLFAFNSEAEFDLVPGKTAEGEEGLRIAPRFQMVAESDTRLAPGGEYILGVKSIDYNHPVGGYWTAPGGIKLDKRMELVLFFVVVAYSDMSDYGKIKDLFEKPLITTKELRDRRMHDFFEENFDLSKLPDCAKAYYWLGYVDRVKPPRTLSLCEFKPRGCSVRAGSAAKPDPEVGPDLGPIRFKGQQYVYMRILFLEENGYEYLRRKEEEGKKALEFGWELAASCLKGPPGIASEVAGRLKNYSVGKAAGWLRSKLVKRYGWMEFEYVYESPQATDAIPLVHRRVLKYKMDGKKPRKIEDETNFELTLTCDRGLNEGATPAGVDIRE